MGIRVAIRSIVLLLGVAVSMGSHVVHAGPVDLQLRPAMQSACVGDSILVTLHAISADGTPDAMAALSVVLQWDPAKLRLLGLLDDAESTYAWQFSLFPDDREIDRINDDRGEDEFWSEQVCTADGQCSVASPGCDLDVPCNDNSECRAETSCDLTDPCPPGAGCCDDSYCFFTGFPINDGDCLYNAASQLIGPPANATPGPTGLVVMKFRFRVLTSGTSEVQILTSGGPNTPTAVYDAAIPGLNILGSILDPPAGVMVDVGPLGTCCNGDVCLGENLTESCCTQQHPGAQFVEGKLCTDAMPCTPGCGACRLHADIEPFFCVVDIGDVLKVLEAYSEVLPCETTSAAGLTPGSLVFDGGCPQTCMTHADCTGPQGPALCVNGLCCDLCDVGEILTVLDVFADPITPACPHPCSYGACELPSPANCCRDGAYLPGGPDSGTSESDCFALDGVYLGDGTTCVESMLPVCR